MRFRTGFHLFVTTPVLVCGSFCGTLFGQGLPASQASAAIQEAPLEPPSPELQQLLAELGSPEFAVRETATIRLGEYGPDALPYLAELRGHSDLEVRQRVSMVYSQVATAWFESRAQRFLAHQTEGEDLPGWSYVRERAGDSDVIRSWFIELSRDNPEFVASLARSVDQRRVAAEQLHDMSMRRQFDQQEPSLTDAFGLLLLLSDPEITLPDSVHRRMHSLVNYHTVADVLNDPVRGATLARLVETWLRTVPESLVPESLLLAQQHQWKVGVEVAKKHLKPELPLDRMLWIAWSLSELGTAADAANLLPFLDDKRVVYLASADGSILPMDLQPIPEDARVTQVRDLALAAALQMHGINLNTAGFPHSTGRFNRPSAESLSFNGPSDDARSVPRQQLDAALQSKAN